MPRYSWDSLDDVGVMLEDYEKRMQKIKVHLKWLMREFFAIWHVCKSSATDEEGYMLVDLTNYDYYVRARGTYKQMTEFAEQKYGDQNVQQYSILSPSDAKQFEEFKYHRFCLE